MRAQKIVFLWLLGTAVHLFAVEGTCVAGEANRTKAQRLNAASVQASAMGDEAGALAAIEEAIRLDAKWDVSYYNRGAILLRQGELDRAIADYDMALSLTSTPYPRYYVSRAAAYRAKGEFEKAIADVKKAIEIDPGDYTLHGELGAAYAYAGKWKKAVEECSIVLKQDPTHYNSLVDRGAALCQMKEFDRGMEDFEKAIRSDKARMRAYMERAWALCDKGMDDDAIKDCDRLLAFKPRDYQEKRNIADVHRMRGVIRRRKGELDPAIADFSEALRLYPKHSAALLDRGQIYGEKKDFAKALADFTEFIRVCPHDPRGYEMRAVAHIALDDPGSAAADLRKAKELSKAK